MSTPYTCGCGRVTRICRYEVTAEQWSTFETFHRLAFDWALQHYSSDSTEAESFAERYAGDCWDDEQPPSFPAFAAAERRAAEREAAARAAVEREERRIAARAQGARTRAARRRAARRNLEVPA